MNKEFWKVLIVYFPFIVTWVSDTTRRKKTLVCMHNEVNKTVQFGRLQCWCYWWYWFIKYTVEIAWHEDWYGHSGNIKVIPSTIWETAVLILLMGRIYNVCLWDYLRGHDIYAPSFKTVDSGIQVILSVLLLKFERL
jgi:hypothetical protein